MIIFIVLNKMNNPGRLFRSIYLNRYIKNNKLTWKQEKECSTPGVTKDFEWYGNIQGEIIANKKL